MPIIVFSPNLCNLNMILTCTYVNELQQQKYPLNITYCDSLHDGGLPLGSKCAIKAK